MLMTNDPIRQARRAYVRQVIVGLTGSGQDVRRTGWFNGKIAVFIVETPADRHHLVQAGGDQTGNMVRHHAWGQVAAPPGLEIRHYIPNRIPFRIVRPQVTVERGQGDLRMRIHDGARPTDGHRIDRGRHCCWSRRCDAHGQAPHRVDAIFVF